MEKALLKRTMKTDGGRDGTITSKDRDFSLSLAKPVEMGGQKNQDKSNPEELFAAGYSACFASSMEYIMMSEGIEYKSFYAEVTCALVEDPSGGFKFAITMHASVDGVDEHTKQHVVDQAYAFCPYSKAIRGNVDVSLIVE